MGKVQKSGKATESQDVIASFAALRISKTSHALRKSAVPTLLPRKSIARHNDLLEAIAADQSSACIPMKVEEGSEAGERVLIDYPMLLQISDLLRSTADLNQNRESPRAKMLPYVSLLRTCRLAAEAHYLYLKHWQSSTSALFTTPVFTSFSFWSHYVLSLSVPSAMLHCGLLAVAALHCSRLGDDTSLNHTSFSSAYRLYAESDRLIRYHNKEENHEVTIATRLCLLVFDFLTGNQEEWLSSILATKLCMRTAGYSSSGAIAQHFFWLIVQHDRLNMHMRNSVSVLDVHDLIWHSALVHQPVYGCPEDVDEIGLLFKELLSIGRHVRQLNRDSTDDQFDNVDSLLVKWKDGFPIRLQTYAYSGQFYDVSCFLHALTCNGGPRAIALHCLFSEIMILRLRFVIDSQKAAIHEHTVTICRLAQSLTTPASVMRELTAADLHSVLSSLFVAGHHLFSEDGKTWLANLLGWIASITGSVSLLEMIDLLQLHWRKERTKPSNNCSR